MAWLVLVQVKNKCERSSPMRPPGVDKTSRLGWRDPVASGVKCGPHGGKNSETKSWTVSWLSLKTKVELGLHGSRVLSGDWRRLHRVRRVCSGSPENHWVTQLSHKTETEDSMRRCGHPGRSNRPGGRSDCPGHRRWEASKRRTRIGIARFASRLSRLRSLGICLMGENLKSSKFTLEGYVSLVIK
jgi:hypothetical protein